MSRKFLRCVFVVVPLLFASDALRAQVRSPRVQEAKSKSPAAGSPRLAPPAQMLLFGAIPVSTNSQEARRSAEVALDKYENVMVDDAIVHAQHATEKDHDFALGYALLAFTSRNNAPNAIALKRAKALLPLATRDEQLLVRWMISVQDRNLLPAISSMNDLLKRYPNNKHVLYLTSTWLYNQQDYDRARKMLESLRLLEPNFAPALNMLGYAYIESGRPDPAKAVASLKHYAELDPGSPNPEDSLGEVLRYAGDDAGSLEHFGAALQIDPTFFTSQLGLGDTLTLLGNYRDARLEYAKAASVAETPRDLLHTRHQEALVYFWEGHPEQGRAVLAAVAQQAKEKKEPYSEFESGLSAAMLAGDDAGELRQLKLLKIHCATIWPG